MGITETIEMKKDFKRLKEIVKKLRPYVNGILITGVFELYFDELEEIINKKR